MIKFHKFYKMYNEVYLNEASKKIDKFWYGRASKGCNGVWQDVQPYNYKLVNKFFYTPDDPISYAQPLTDNKGSEPGIQQGLQKIVNWWQDGNLTFPLRCYFPPTINEFKNIIDSGKIIRFTDEGTSIYHIFGKNKIEVVKDTNNTLNEMCDFFPIFEY